MNPWAAVIGRRSTGKREVTWQVIEALRRRGLRVGGAMQQPLGSVDASDGFDLVDVASGERSPLARQTTVDATACGLGFDDAGFERAHALVTAPELDVAVLDVGKLEARGEGHFAALDAALRGPWRLLLLCVRQETLFYLADRLPDPVDGLELPASAAQLAQFIDTLALGAQRRP